MRSYPDIVVRVGVIATDRLILRPLRPADSEALPGLWDEEFMGANGWEPETCTRALEVLRDLPPRLAREFAIVGRTTGELIGTVSVDDVDLDSMTCSLGWTVGPPWRRRGYGTEAICAVLHGLHRIGMRSVRIGTSTSNLAARRVAEKAGAVLSEQRDHTLPDGSRVESVWYEHLAT